MAGGGGRKIDFQTSRDLKYAAVVKKKIEKKAANVMSKVQFNKTGR